MKQFGRWIVAMLDEWITLLTGGGITAAIGLLERYTSQPLPAFVYTCIIGAFLLIANFRVFRKLEIELIQKRKETETPPTIRVSRYYVDSRFWGSGGHYETPLSCLHVRLTNDPAYSVEQAIGRDVFAQLQFRDAAGNPLFGFNGRWGDTEQPLNPLQPVVQLEPVDFLIGAERELDLAFKYSGDQECYAFRNETYRIPDWRDATRALRGERFSVFVRVRGLRVDQAWIFHFRNLGQGNGIEAADFEPASTSPG